MYYGIAYDDSEEAIQFAKNTKHKLIETIEKINNNEYLNFFSEKVNDDKFISFLRYLECYFGVSFCE